LVDGVAVIVGANECRLRESLRHQHGGGTAPASDVGDADPGVQLLLDPVQRRQPGTDQVRVVPGPEEPVATGENLGVVLVPADALTGPEGRGNFRLRGSAAAAVATAYEQVRRLGTQAQAAELGYWLRACGVAVPVDESDHPYALQATGRWREAAQRWQRTGCRYEYASALAQSPEPDDVLRALAMLDGLRAEPLARRVRMRLRELGVTRIPRGPVPSTRDNPGGLTDRQVEVVRLLADGLSNAEIAERLVLSVRTVDTHVAAVLDKLDARGRRDAATRARSLGLLAAS
jgi:DNA-binding CsgD family transcriptional regulator